MKKHLFALMCLLLSGAVLLPAKEIELGVGIFDPTSSTNPYPRTPVPSIDLSDGILTFQQNHSIYTLVILDEEEVVVYSVAVPSTLTTVTLPSWLSGEYEIRLYPTDSNIYFYGWIEL